MDEEGKDSKNVQVEPTCFGAQYPTEAQVCEIREEEKREKEGKDSEHLPVGPTSF